MKPIVFDFFCGLGGWSEAFIAEGYDAIGFDIEAHDYGNGGYPGKLVLRDIRQINGAELVKTYGVPTCIVASPPCQFFSYCAMPWSRAKTLAQAVRADPARTEKELELFNACFRIQREICEAAGHYVPMVVENVRGAQRWVGKARWAFGSFLLWGDVPALMPIPAKIRKTPEGSWDLTRKNYNSDHKWEGVKPGITHRANGATNFHGFKKSEGHKTVGMNWSDRSIKGQDFTRVAGVQAEGVKGFTPNGEPMGKNVNSKFGSKSKARKQASAEIAKIPYALASWIARTFLKGVEK